MYMQVPQLPSALTFNLPLKWKKLIKMPSGVDCAQAVVIGEKVYIGGGEAKGGSYKVLEYTIQEGWWREIDAPVEGFGMAEVNNQLIITGGVDKDGCFTDEVWVLDGVSRTWKQPFPAMPTARWGSSAVGYKRWVLVVGGYGDICVEVLDTAARHWYTATPLPSDAQQPSLTVIEDTLYVLWGHSSVRMSIPMLISDAMSQSPASDTSNGPKPTEWQPLPDTPTKDPTTTTLNGSLFAVGGYTIAMYLPQTEKWLKVAKLPTPCCWCTCALLPETEELMVIGGVGENDCIKSIDLCTL